jgi:hypothetical protein
MRTVRLSAALAVLLAGASCAHQSLPGDASEESPEITSTVLPKPPGLAASDLPPAMRPNESRPDPQVVDLRPARWAAIETVSGRQVRVYYTITGRGDCAALGRVDVTETATTVTITLQLGRLSHTDCTDPQPQLAASVATIVTLGTPLGDRVVHDGAIG